MPWKRTLFIMGGWLKIGVYTGHVLRESDDVLAVFSDTDNLRWDIPKKLTKVTGKNVFLDMDIKDLAPCQVSQDSPLPPSVRK